MSKADQVREYLKANPTGNCKEAFEGFVGESKVSMHYSQFNTIFRKYCSSNDIELVKTTREVNEEDLPYEEKNLHGETAFPYKVWKNLTLQQTVDENSVGKRVAVAGEDIEYKVESFHKKGEKFWPVADGVVVVNDKYGKRHFYVECVKICH